MERSERSGRSNARFRSSSFPPSSFIPQLPEGRRFPPQAAGVANHKPLWCCNCCAVWREAAPDKQHQIQAQLRSVNRSVVGVNVPNKLVWLRLGRRYWHWLTVRFVSSDKVFKILEFFRLKGLKSGRIVDEFETEVEIWLFQIDSASLGSSAYLEFLVYNNISFTLT